MHVQNMGAYQLDYKHPKESIKFIQPLYCKKITDKIVHSKEYSITDLMIRTIEDVYHEDMIYDLIRITPDGLYICYQGYAYLDERNEAELSMPEPIFLYPLKHDSTWQWAREEQFFKEKVFNFYKVSGYEQLKTPAGKFNTIVIEVKNQKNSNYEGRIWAASGVGIVQTEDIFKDKSRKVIRTVKSFKIPKEDEPINNEEPYTLIREKSE